MATVVIGEQQQPGRQESLSEADRVQLRTLVALYRRGSHQEFSLCQSLADLKLQTGNGGAGGGFGKAELYIDNVFRRGVPLLVTITADRDQTAVYAKGALVRDSARFAIPPEVLSGNLVAGTSPVTDESWAGVLKGMAIYTGKLTSSEVKSDYESWTTLGRPSAATKAGREALYVFDEHFGDTVHNKVGLGTDLRIPERYMILNETFLNPPWKEFQPDWSYVKDVIINIGGFIPLGFLFCPIFSSVETIKRPWLPTIILGFATSLTIEVLQALLPTRDSGMTDLITNTMGTAVGVVLYGWRPLQMLFARALGFVPFS